MEIVDDGNICALTQRFYLQMSSIRMKRVMVFRRKLRKRVTLIYYSQNGLRKCSQLCCYYENSL